MLPSSVVNTNALDPFGVALSNRPMWLWVMTSHLSHMMFQGFSFWEFSPHIGFNIAMPKITKRSLRLAVGLTSKRMAMIVPLIIRNFDYMMSASPFSQTFFLFDQALGPWAQFLGAFAISRFERKRCCSWKTFDSRNHEIRISHFRALGYGCTWRWETWTPDSQNHRSQINIPLLLTNKWPRSSPSRIGILRSLMHNLSTF